ncbi:hypothetical protein Dsin_015102 [Dipteronia sinensis]|uniref:2Fe-2S ferredoxin-type domain-containing protein n=1 Tax=Dipteronia sinensis TaxID=43782 RepID=A0AAE0ANF4_9ROSI|nr:hypothetical protein Dsin_015102 [Dipteronia sinensis]
MHHVTLSFYPTFFLQGGWGSLSFSPCLLDQQTRCFICLTWMKYFDANCFVVLMLCFCLISGACEGSLACSTCHVIVMDMDYYNKLEDPTDEENDMLDLAFGLTESSRLGCQIVAKPELDGIRVAIPAATRNFALSNIFSLME